jgi:hypothetical protein
VALSTGVVKLLPDPSELPPLDAAYQFTVPPVALADKLTVPLPHTAPSVTPVTSGKSLTVTLTVLLAAEQPSAS